MLKFFTVLIDGAMKNVIKIVKEVVQSCYEIVFYALFVRDHYFAHCEFI